MVHKSDVTYEVPLSSFSDFVGIQTEMIAETEEKLQFHARDLKIPGIGS